MGSSVLSERVYSLIQETGTRRQGHEAVTRVAILRDNGRQYYVLSGFVEG